MLQTFLPVFCMTFLICLFIVLMQFLWKYVDEMVGKGLELKVLFELFFYAALSLAPMALPLAILLASLMTFGNLGERLELLAMKASGVSLLRIMRPLIIIISFIAVGAFFFQNEVLPRAQVKLYSLLFSMRHKSPELDIPEGVFYKEIDGYNLYVKHKDRETGILKDVMIYDITGGFEDVSVIVADSGKLKMTDDKQFLYLTLWNGESFENLKGQRTSYSNVPYRRETFSKKEILIEFDANFNRMDESFMSNQYIGKNMSQLQSSIDSMSVRQDSIARVYANNLQNNVYFNGTLNNMPTDTADKVQAVMEIDADSILQKASLVEKSHIFNNALAKAQSVKQDFDYRQSLQSDENKTIRRHKIEMHKKFTLSFACLIFFFIGAPLGAIIRKGGLGMPVVISVMLFIVYYIVDTAGYKMARDGQWPVWEGVWLSSAVLLPLGIFFTSKAVNDSVLFNIEVYINTLRNFFGMQKPRTFVRKEVIIETLNPVEFKAMVSELDQRTKQYLEETKNPRSIQFFNFYMGNYKPKELDKLVTHFNILLEVGSNAADNQILKTLSNYPVLYKMSFGTPAHKPWIGLLIALFVPFSIPYYLLARFKRGKRIQALTQVLKNDQELLNLL